MSVSPDGGVVDPAAVEPDPTADEATRNAETEANKGKLIASLQEKAARVNAAEARAAAAEAEAERLRRAQSPAAHSNGTDPRQTRAEKVKAWAEGRGVADESGDVVAQDVLDLREELRMTQQEMANMRAIDGIKDDEKRTKVQEHFNANRHRLGDPKAALAEVEAAEAVTLREENERLAKALREAQQPPGVAPPTHHQAVPASTLRARTMSEIEYKDSRRGLSTFDLLKVEEQLDKGEIKLK